MINETYQPQTTHNNSSNKISEIISKNKLTLIEIGRESKTGESNFNKVTNKINCGSRYYI